MSASRAAAVVAVLLVGGALLPRLGSEAGAPPQRATPTVGAAVRERAAEVYAAFAGTELQRNSASVLRAHAQNGAMDACMEAEGFPEWDWSLSRGYATPQDPLAHGTWFGEPHGRFLSEPMMALRLRMQAEQEMNRDDIPPDEEAAIGRCLDTTEPPSDRAVERHTSSPTASRLLDAWSEMIDDTSDAAGDSDAYLRCMDEADIPVLDDLGIPAADMWEGFSSLGPSDGRIPSSADDPLADSEAWQAFLAEERVITDADWACREDVYTEHIDDLLPMIDRFERAHADEIEQAQREWAEIEERARALGYTGQTGSLDQG